MTTFWAPIAIVAADYSVIEARVLAPSMNWHGVFEDYQPRDHSGVFEDYQPRDHSGVIEGRPEKQVFWGVVPATALVGLSPAARFLMSLVTRPRWAARGRCTYL